MTSTERAMRPGHHLLRCVLRVYHDVRLAQRSQQRSSLSRKGKSQDKSRIIPFRPPEKLQSKYPPNVVRNQKYNVFTFLPLVFYEQFKFFFNLYFLLVALSQFVPALKIGASDISTNSTSSNLTVVGRLHHHVHSTSGLRVDCYDGKGGIRRL